MISIVSGSSLEFPVSLPEKLSLQHNLPMQNADFFIVRFYKTIMEIAFEALIFGDEIKFGSLSVQVGVPYKVLAIKILGGVADGMWWADNFILQDGVVNIDFKSQGEAGGSGELKTFSGSLTQDGQPVSCAVYALAIGGDVPKLLASAVSDAAGNYSLQWNGYTGQILVTATDDYGAPFAAEALLGIGARVHPATPNGYVYEVASAGTLGLTEPAWPAIEGESVTSGQVQLVAKPFYRPKSAGPFTIA